MLLGNQVVELLHWDGTALAASLALPRLDGAGVVAIPPSLPGPERHRSAAAGAEADAGKEGWAAHDARRRHLRIARAQMRLHGVERRLVDERRNVDDYDLACGFQRLIFGALVELVLADVGLASEDAMDLPDAPASAVAGEDASLVKMSGDVLDAHRSRFTVAF